MPRVSTFETVWKSTVFGKPSRDSRHLVWLSAFIVSLTPHCLVSALIPPVLGSSLPREAAPEPASDFPSCARTPTSVPSSGGDSHPHCGLSMAAEPPLDQQFHVVNLGNDQTRTQASQSSSHSFAVMLRAALCPAS